MSGTIKSTVNQTECTSKQVDMMANCAHDLKTVCSFKNIVLQCYKFMLNHSTMFFHSLSLQCILETNLLLVFSNLSERP
jgi:hypothetical protein